MRFGFATTVMLLAACLPLLANPIDVRVPHDGAPLPMKGRVTFDNAHDYPQYALLVTRTRQLYHDEYDYGQAVPLCAVRRDLLDSVQAAQFADSVLLRPMMKDFLNNDPRVLRAKWSPPSLPIQAYTLPNGGCKVIEDVCHIVKLDSSGFDVVPVRAVYRYTDTLFQPITVQSVWYTNPSVRPAPHVLWYRFRQSLGLFASLSLASLAILVAMLLRRKRAH